MRISLLCFLFTISLFESGKPTFSDYPVSFTFKGKPASVNLSSHPSARMYRTRLREGQSKGPNFADHYTITIWGCGSECQRFAIVDARNGKVFFPSYYAKSGLLFKRDSKLIILNPLDSVTVSDLKNYIPEGWTTRYLIWDGCKLSQIDSSTSIMPKE